MKLYYYQSGNLKRVPKYMRFEYENIEKAIEDVELYWRLKDKYNNSTFTGLLPLIKQFVLVDKDKITYLMNHAL